MVKTFGGVLGAAGLVLGSTAASAAPAVHASSALPAATTAVPALSVERAMPAGDQDSRLAGGIPLAALFGIGALIAVVIIVSVSSGNGNSPG